MKGCTYRIIESVPALSFCQTGIPAQIRFSFYGLLPLFQLHILPGICFSSAAELGFTIHGSFFLSKHFPNVVDFLPHQ